MQNKKVLKIFTDGAYSSSRDRGGIGVIVLDDKIHKYYHGYDRTTNNQMELVAIIIALRYITKSYDSIIIYSDSQYCIGCATLGWQRKKNKKLWNEFDKQFKRVKELCSDITFKHVRGHQNDDSEETMWNNMVDKLAVKASQLI